MIDYLINVAMAASTLWTASIVLLVFSFLYVRKHSAEYHSSFKALSGIIFIIGLMVGLTSSANTYKNTVDYNPVQAQRQIEQARELEEPAEIVDRTRKPQSVEDRAANSVDMRDRVENIERNQLNTDTSRN
jgi:cytochrome bd-type quinol oxidase subunit 1